VRPEDRLVGVGTEAAKEGKGRVVHGNQSVSIAVAEHVNVNATFLDLSEGVRRQALEGDLVVTGQIEGLNVLEGARGKEEPVIAEQGLSPGGVDVQGNICGLAIGAITGLSERELDILVACTCCVGD
jgi:hypothetical protein